MGYRFQTPAGTVTVDSSATVGQLLKAGARPARWPDIQTAESALIGASAKSRGMSADEYLMRFARKSAGL